MRDYPEEPTRVRRESGARVEERLRGAHKGPQIGGFNQRVGEKSAVGGDQLA